MRSSATGFGGSASGKSGGGDGGCADVRGGLGGAVLSDGFGGSARGKSGGGDCGRRKQWPEDTAAKGAALSCAGGVFLASCSTASLQSSLGSS